MGGAGGFSIQIGLSSLGPLSVQLSASLPTGILLDPDTGLSINNFIGGVSFFSSLPSITTPEQLRDPAFQITAGQSVDPSMWLSTLEGQVVTQYNALQANPNMSGFEAAFTQPMIIKGSATLFDEYVSQAAFSGKIDLELSTPNVQAGEFGPKIFLGGQLLFANGLVTMSAKLYADLSHVSNGDVKVFFLADIPDQVQLLTLKGVLSLGFVDAHGNPVITPIPDLQPDTISQTSPTADLANQQPNGGVVDLDTINSDPYIYVTYHPSAGHALNTDAILNGGPTFTLDGPGAADITGIGPAEAMGDDTYRYKVTGQFDVGQVNVHFLANTWSDDATPGGNHNLAEDESFTVFAQAAAFAIHLGSPLDAPEGTASAILLLQAPDNLLSDPLLDISGSATLKVDTTRLVFTLDVTGNLSMYYLGTIGAAAGRFVLDLSAIGSATPSDSDFFSSLTPKFWGVLEIQANLDKLTQFGIAANGTALLEINSTGDTKTETITLPGLAGDTIFSVSDTTLVSALDSGALPQVIFNDFTANDIVLAAGTGVSVINPGHEWEVTDTAHKNAKYFIELDGNELDVKGEAQTFNLAPYTLEVAVTGELVVSEPANSGNEWFRLDGGFFFKIDTTGLEAFVTADLVLGPPALQVFDFNATGLLLINNQGIAAHINVDLTAGSTAQLGFGLAGQFELDMNTTGAPQSFTIPSQFLSILSPAELLRLAPTDGKTIDIPAGPPQLGGGDGPASSYFVISGSSTLELDDPNTHAAVLDIDGTFRLSVTPSEIDLIFSGTSVIPVLGTFSVTGSFIVDPTGLFGSAQLVLQTGTLIPDVNFNAQFFLAINTSNAARLLDTYTIDTTNDATFGQVSSVPTLESVDPGIHIEAGGNLLVGDPSIGQLTIQGAFSFDISPSGLDVDVQGRVGLGPLGYLSVDNTLAISSAGIQETLTVSTGLTLPGGGFQFTGFFQLVMDTITTPIVEVVVGGSLILSSINTPFGTTNIGLNGTFTLNVQPTSIMLGIDADLNLFGTDIPVHKTATISAPGLVLDQYLDLNTLNIDNALITLHGSFELLVNTTGQSSQGVPPKTAEIIVHNLNLGLLSDTLNATGSLTIGFVNGGFYLNIPTNDPLSLDFFGLALPQLYGYINPDGTFQLTSTISRQSRRR